MPAASTREARRGNVDTMKRLVRSVVLVAGLFAFGGCVVHVNDGGSQIGEPAADGSINLGWHLFKKKGKKEREVYPVGVQHGEFSAIRLTTSNAPAQVKRVIITFGNGERFEPKVRPRMEKNSSTRWIDLPGGKRKIHDVVVVAHSPAKLLAKIEVYAKR